jgi:DnaB-like helicase N terminal domain/AAA domain
VDAEKGVLSSLLQAPTKVAPLCARARIGPKAFFAPSHSITFETVLEWPEPRAVDFVWLSQTLQDRGQLEEVGGKEFLNELYGFVPTADNADYYVRDVYENWARRTCIEEATARINAAQDPMAGADQWDPEGKLTSGLEARKLSGASLLAFSQRQVDPFRTLLGNDRYLCRGGGLLTVAPSGAGKSVLTVQKAVLWAAGRPGFGIRPASPLRSLIIQAEDDEGDTIEMARIIDHLELNARERELVGKNTHIEFVNDLTGDNFLEACGGFLHQWPCDVLFINPYTSYSGCDIQDDGENSRFLRNGLNPLLTRHNCAAVIIHHTPKTNHRNTENWKASDWMYAGAGVAVITNWARAILVIDPCDQPGVYKFIAAKRGKRIGWGNPDPILESYWAHSTDEGKLLWVPANSEQIASARPKGASGPDDLLQLIPVVDPISQERLFFEAKQRRGIGQNKVRNFLNILLEEHKISKETIKRDGVKSGVAYVQTGDES